MITDDQFKAWLKTSSGDPVILVEFPYSWREVGTPDTVEDGMIYMASGPYRTGPSDTPASQPYRDCIRSVPAFTRSIDDKLLGGRANASFGTLELENADGSLDWLLTVATDNTQASFYYGDSSWPRSDFRLMFTSTLQEVNAPSLDKITIDLIDNSTVLNASIGGEPIGGSGPNANRSKPILLGKVYQVEALVEDAASLLYRIADRNSYTGGAEIMVLEQVLDSGANVSDSHQISGTSGGGVLSIDAGTDVVTYNTHDFIDEDIVRLQYGGASIGPATGVFYWVVNKTTNTFQISNTRGGSPINFTGSTWTGVLSFTRYNFVNNGDGSFYVSHTPLGQITCDVLMPVATGQSISGSDIISCLVQDLGGLDSSLWNGAHATFTVGDVQDFTLGIVLPQARNILDTLQDTMFSMRAFFGFNRLGKFTFGRIRPAVLGVDVNFDADAVVATIDQDSFTFGTLKLAHVMPQSYRNYTVIGNKRWSAIGSLATGLTPEEVAVLTSKGSYYRNTPTTDADAPWSYHKSITDSPEIDTLLSEESGYFDFETELGPNWVDATEDTLRPWVEIVQMDANIEYYDVELGDVVRFISPAYNATEKYTTPMGVPTLSPDDTANQLFQVIGVNLQLTNRIVGLTLVHRRLGDSLMRGTHNA